MKAQSIATATGMGAVDLTVTDADRALRFYRDYVGLAPVPGDGPEVRMAAAGRELLVLHPGARRPVVQRRSGLYHFAIVVPDRRELARVIGRLARLQWDQYPTDHVMTKANYLWDPDGNGIEIYTESPEDGTLGFANGTFVAHDKDGRERSGRDPIDLEELFTHLQPGDPLDAPMPYGTKMGHIHLHVSDVDEALRFYHDLVGFDIMGHVPGVGFVSAGGYHHHLGLNEWDRRVCAASQSSFRLSPISKMWSAASSVPRFESPRKTTASPQWTRRRTASCSGSQPAKLKAASRGPRPTSSAILPRADHHGPVRQGCPRLCGESHRASCGPWESPRLAHQLHVCCRQRRLPRMPHSDPLPPSARAGSAQPARRPRSFRERFRGPRGLHLSARGRGESGPAGWRHLRATAQAPGPRAATPHRPSG